MSEQPKRAVQPDEVVPWDLRKYLRWDERHDAAARMPPWRTACGSSTP